MNRYIVINWWGNSGPKTTVAGCLSLGLAAYGLATGCFPATARSQGQPVCMDASPGPYWVGLIALFAIGTLFVWRGSTSQH